MPTLAAYIEGRLAYGVRLKLETKIVVGDGRTSGARSFIGLIEANQFIEVVPEVDDTAIDIINKAKYKASAGGLLPEAIILNPEENGELLSVLKGMMTTIFLVHQVRLSLRTLGIASNFVCCNAFR